MYKINNAFYLKRFVALKEGFGGKIVELLSLEFQNKEKIDDDN